MTNSKPDFYVGQEVQCLVHGNGKIVDISTKKSDRLLPILVHFEKGGICMYNLAGEVSPTSAGRTLFPRGSLKITPLEPGSDAPNFKVGQEVECVAFGFGKITHIFPEKAAAFPVQAIFENGSLCMYSHTGKMSISACRTLYVKGSVKIEIEE